MPLGWQIARLPVFGHITEHLLLRPLIVQGLHAVYADPAQVTEPLEDRYFELTLRAGDRAARAMCRRKKTRRARWRW